MTNQSLPIDAAPAATHDDQAMTLREVASMFAITSMSVWRAVRDERLPAPFYVRPRAPRWIRSELIAARERLRMLPSEAKAEARAAKLRAARREGAVAWLCIDCGHQWEGADVRATRCPGCGREIIAADDTE